MKLNIFDLTNKKTGAIELPMQFNEQVREDIVSRAVLALNSNKRHPYGSFEEAGKRASAEISKRRRNYRGSYGLGISRSPRKIMSRRGARMNWVGAFSPNTVGGRRAHPPKSWKVWDKKINKKERKLAIRVGISATVSNDWVNKRGHIIPENYPFLLDNKFEELAKTKEVLDALKLFGFDKELERVSKKSTRSGRARLRGRKYKIKKGPLIVVSKNSNVSKAAANIPGIDVVNVKELNVDLLAPGEMPGRLTLWTAGAIELLDKEELFR